MSSRLNEYARIVDDALSENYTFLTIAEFHSKLVSNDIKETEKYFISRHDIDSDIRTALRFFEIEKKKNIKSSFYFRLSTSDYELIKKINKYGSEASYHFEEIAQFAKNNRIKTKEEIEDSMNEIRNIFSNNFKNFETQCGYKLYSVASHGDFVNRRLGMPNHMLLNEEIRRQLDIKVECYDEILLKNYSLMFSDANYPLMCKDISIYDAIKAGYKVIYLLSHPRNWAANIGVNIRQNVKRIYESLKY